MEKIIAEINKIASDYFYLEGEISSFKDNKLIMAFGEDLIYYRSFEIHFGSVFAIIGKTSFKVMDTKSLLQLENTSNEYKALNEKYRVENGFKIFKFVDEDDIPLFVISGEIALKKISLKY